VGRTTVNDEPSYDKCPCRLRAHRDDRTARHERTDTRTNHRNGHRTASGSRIPNIVLKLRDAAAARRSTREPGERAKGVPGGLGTVESDHEDVLSAQTLLFPVPAYCRARRPAASRRVAPATTPASVSLRRTVVSGSASAGSTSTRCREPRPPGRSSPACLVCRHRVAPADFRQALGLHRDVGRHQRPCRALPRACLLPLYRVRMRRVNTLFRLVMLSLTRKRGQRGVGDCAEECQHSRWGQPEKSFDGRADDCEQDSGDEQCEKRRHSLSAVQIRFGGCGRVAESRASHRGARCSALARSRRRPNGSNHEPEHHAENGTPRRRRQRQGDQEQNDGQEQNAVPARGR